MGFSGPRERVAWEGDIGRPSNPCSPVLQALSCEICACAFLGAPPGQALLAPCTVWRRSLTSNKFKTSQLCTLLMPRSQRWWGCCWGLRDSDSSPRAASTKSCCRFQGAACALRERGQDGSRARGMEDSSGPPPHPCRGGSGMDLVSLPAFPWFTILLYEKADGTQRVGDCLSCDSFPDPASAGEGVEGEVKSSLSSLAWAVCDQPSERRSLAHAHLWTCTQNGHKSARSILTFTTRNTLCSILFYPGSFVRSFIPLFFFSFLQMLVLTHRNDVKNPRGGNLQLEFQRISTWASQDN